MSPPPAVPLVLLGPAARAHTKVPQIASATRCPTPALQCAQDGQCRLTRPALHGASGPARTHPGNNRGEPPPCAPSAFQKTKGRDWGGGFPSLPRLSKPLASSLTSAIQVSAWTSGPQSHSTQGGMPHAASCRCHPSLPWSALAKDSNLFGFRSWP